MLAFLLFIGLVISTHAGCFYNTATGQLVESVNSSVFAAQPYVDAGWIGISPQEVAGIRAIPSMYREWTEELGVVEMSTEDKATLDASKAAIRAGSLMISYFSAYQSLQWLQDNRPDETAIMAAIQATANSYKARLAVLGLDVP